VVEEVFERSLKQTGQTDDPEIVKFLMKHKKLNSAFDLLRLEKQRAYSAYEKYLRKN